jgi:hypothetical protein
LGSVLSAVWGIANYGCTARVRLEKGEKEGISNGFYIGLDTVRLNNGWIRQSVSRRRTVKWLALFNLAYILTTMLLLALSDLRKTWLKRM